MHNRYHALIEMSPTRLSEALGHMDEGTMKLSEGNATFREPRCCGRRAIASVSYATVSCGLPFAIRIRAHLLRLHVESAFDQQATLSCLWATRPTSLSGCGWMQS